MYHDGLANPHLFSRLLLIGRISLCYDDKIFCLNENGDTFVIQAGPEHKILGLNQLEEMCMATPAIARGSLFVRTYSKLYRIKKG